MRVCLDPAYHHFLLLLRGREREELQCWFLYHNHKHFWLEPLILIALRNASASLDVWDINWTYLLGAFLLIHLMMHKMMGIFFFLAWDLSFWYWAFGKNDEKLRCSAILGGKKFSSLFLKVSWGVGSLADHNAGGPYWMGETLRERNLRSLSLIHDWGLCPDCTPDKWFSRCSTA